MRPRFDVDALREVAGEKLFARGEAYHRDGQVVVLSIEPGRVLAQVAGTEDYRTELTGRGEEIGGACSCPAYEGWGFCKHMVAAALAANAVGSDAGAESGALARIREHLKTKGIDALVEMIMDLAERDAALFRRLDMAAAAMQGDDKMVESRLRKAIDSATSTGSYVDYREAADWATNVEEALDAVADLVTVGRASLALKLVDFAIDRVEQAIGSIDDSDGDCSALLDGACEIHLAAACAARPEPVQLARDLFVREMESDYDAFSGTVTLYADVLGEEGLGEYHRLASEAWEKLLPRSGTRQGEHDPAGDYDRLAGILDFFAERNGDVEARIALRTKDLSSQWSYLQLAEFCLAQGREEEALRRAEEGLWVFEDDCPDQRLVFFAVDLLARTGRKDDAGAHLWRVFEKAPSFELYGQLRNLGGEVVRERALKILEPHLANERRTRWHSPADLLIRILMQEMMFDAAWAAVRKHGASMDLQETLARASEATHPREALETYAERVDQLANGSNTRSYAEAAALIARMAALRSTADHAAYVAELKARFGRKRTFMKLLP